MYLDLGSYEEGKLIRSDCEMIDFYLNLSLPSSSLSFLVTSSLSYQLLQLLTATQLPRLPLLPSLDANSSITLLLDMQLNSRPLNGQQLEMRTTLLEVDPVQRTARNEQLQTLTME